MSRGPTTPDRPRLELDPQMSTAEQLSALTDHYRQVRRINAELSEQLESALDRSTELSDRVDALQRENAVLKTAPNYIATIEDHFEDELVIRQHGSNQEVVTEKPTDPSVELSVGTRVAVNDSFGIELTLDPEMDARTRAMAIDTAPDVTYDDIGGLDEQIREVQETVELPLVDPEVFESVGVEPPSGVLLYGDPGTGKTMLAKAVANRTDAAFIKMAGSELVQKFIGEGARLVRDLFELAAEEEPAVVFIDELDALAARRTDSKTAGDAEVQRTMMQLLSEMDGFDDRGDIRLIAATNRFDMLDPAILRPGRFDRLIEVPPPDLEGRKRIFEIHTRDMNVADAVSFERLAAETTGASGADIKAICTEAGMFAIRDERTEVREVDFLAAESKLAEAADSPIESDVFYF